MAAAPSLVSRILTAVLTHPLALAIKRPLRDLRWTLRGRELANPPLPERVSSVLFVCLGNICRSPFGAVLAAALEPAPGRVIAYGSAGLRPSQANQSPDDACVAAEAYGVTLRSHLPQAVTPELLAEYDLVVVMEAAQLQYMRHTYPEHASRVVLLSLFDEEAEGGYERLNIADPFGHGPAAFAYCYARMARSTKALVKAIERTAPKSTRP